MKNKIFYYFTDEIIGLIWYILLFLAISYASIGAYERYNKLQQGCQELVIRSYMFHTEMEWECPKQ